MVMTGVGTVKTRQLWKVADTITRTEHAAIEFMAIINEATWQSLTPGYKAIISEAARRAENDLRKLAAASEKDAYAFAREKGMEVYHLTPDQVAEWRACSAEVLDVYLGGSGDLVPQLMAAYGKLRTDPCCAAGPAVDSSFKRH
jgi:C4-dicarboxylate-binding protein DctP